MNPPTIGFNTPTANQTITGTPNAAVVFDVSAADDGQVTQVAYFSGTNLLSTQTVAPFGFTWNNVSEGTYTVTAVATDNDAMT